MSVARSSLLVGVLLLLPALARAAPPSMAVDPPTHPTEPPDRRETAFGASLGGLHLPSGV
ncbi:MAG TPA: hypothetical protein VGG39_16700 [Polyangiaceae bacterium]|jgi:hypothetical protein